MISEMQREALAVLAVLCELSPDVRLGQLVSHLGFLSECLVGKGLGDIDDDELTVVMYRHRAELLARTQTASNQAPMPHETDISVSGSPKLPEMTSLAATA